MKLPHQLTSEELAFLVRATGRPLQPATTTSSGPPSSKPSGTTTWTARERAFGTSSASVCLCACLPPSPPPPLCFSHASARSTVALALALSFPRSTAAGMSACLTACRCMSVSLLRMTARHDACPNTRACCVRGHVQCTTERPLFFTFYEAATAQSTPFAYMHAPSA